MGFLDNYLTVNEKVKLAHEKHPNCRIIANIIEHDLAAGYALVQADFYREESDLSPAFRDFAYGNVAFYPQNMKRWFIEDTVSSAIGRVIAVALATTEKPNRETMEQIERAKPDPNDQGVWGIQASAQESMATAATAIDEIATQLGGEVLSESPICLHGHMIFREGKKKDGGEYGGWFCTERARAKQCPPVWAVRSVTNGMKWRMA